MLSRFLRSAIQATDSTLRGCSANSAATIKLGPAEPVARSQHQEQQQHIHHVKQKVGVVMSGWVQLEKLVVQRVRKPRQRMPVRFVIGRERPGNGLPIQPRLDRSVLDDVSLIVVVDEGMAVHRVVDSNGPEREDESPEERPSARSGATRLPRVETEFSCRSSISSSDFRRH